MGAQEKQSDNTALVEKLKSSLKKTRYHNYSNRTTACILNQDASICVIGNDIDRIVIWDINQKKQICDIYDPYGHFFLPEFRLSPDGNALGVIYTINTHVPVEIGEAFPEVFSVENFKKYQTRFSIYNAKNGSFLKDLIVVKQPYTSSGELVTLEDAMDYEKLIEATGAIVKKRDGTIIAIADRVKGRRASFAPFAFSQDSSSVITILSGGFLNGYSSGVLGEKLNIQDNKLDAIYSCCKFEDETELAPVSEEVTALALSGDGRYTVMVGDSNQYALFETETGKILCAKKIPRGPGAAMFFQDCLVVNKDGSLFAWQGASPNSYSKAKQLKDRKTNGVPYYTGKGCSVAVLNSQTGEPLHEFLTPDPLIVTSIAFSHDGQYLAAGTLFGHVFLWDIMEGKLSKHFKMNHPDIKKTVIGFKDKEDELVAVFFEKTSQKVLVHEWNYRTGKEMGSHSVSVRQ